MSFPVINISVLRWWLYVWTVTTTSAWGVWYRISNIGYSRVWRRMISITTSLPCDRWCSNWHLLSSENYCAFIYIAYYNWLLAKKRNYHFSFAISSIFCSFLSAPLNIRTAILRTKARVFCLTRVDNENSKMKRALSSGHEKRRAEYEGPA